jgi:hypothetical protein
VSRRVVGHFLIERKLVEEMVTQPVFERHSLRRVVLKHSESKKKISFIFNLVISLCHSNICLDLGTFRLGERR